MENSQSPSSDYYGALVDWYESHVDGTDRVMHGVDTAWLSHSLEALLLLSCTSGYYRLIQDLCTQLGADALRDVVSTHQCFLYTACRHRYLYCAQEIVHLVTSSQPSDVTQCSMSEPNTEANAHKNNIAMATKSARLTASSSSPSEELAYFEEIIQKLKNLDHKTSRTEDDWTACVDDMKRHRCNCLYAALCSDSREIVSLLLEYPDIGAVEEALVQKLPGRNTCLLSLIDVMPETLALFFDRKISEKPQRQRDFMLFMPHYKKSNGGRIYRTRHILSRTHHPVLKIYDTGNTELSHHPYTTSYLVAQWSRVRVYHFIKLLWFLSWVFLTTAYMVTAQEYKHGDQMLHQKTVTPTNVAFREWLQDWNKINALLLIIGSCVGIAFEIIQIILLWKFYVHDSLDVIVNVLEWFMYVAAIWAFGLVDDMERTSTEWQLGATVTLVSWFVLLLHHPIFSPYLRIAISNIITLWRFTFMFILFLLMFGFAFAFLLVNQQAHNYLGSSLVRTWTMMLGDISYTDMFYPEEPFSEVQYSAATYLIFFLFLLLGLIITNMWTGFIITKLEETTDKMQIQEAEMQLCYALTVQMMFPQCLLGLFCTSRFSCPLASHRFIMFLRDLCGDRCAQPAETDAKQKKSMKQDANALQNYQEKRISCLAREIVQIEHSMKNMENTISEIKDLNLQMLRKLENLTKGPSHAGHSEA